MFSALDFGIRSVLQYQHYFPQELGPLAIYETVSAHNTSVNCLSFSYSAVHRLSRRQLDAYVNHSLSLEQTFKYSAIVDTELLNHTVALMYYMYN